MVELLQSVGCQSCGMTFATVLITKLILQVWRPSGIVARGGVCAICPQIIGEEGKVGEPSEITTWDITVTQRVRRRFRDSVVLQN
jgi:hypothetical protein